MSFNTYFALSDYYKHKHKLNATDHRKILGTIVSHKLDDYVDVNNAFKEELKQQLINKIQTMIARNEVYSASMTTTVKAFYESTTNKSIFNLFCIVMLKHFEEVLREFDCRALFSALYDDYQVLKINYKQLLIDKYDHANVQRMYRDESCLTSYYFRFCLEFEAANDR